MSFHGDYVEMQDKSAAKFSIPYESSQGKHFGTSGSLRCVLAVRTVLQVPVGLCDSEAVYKRLEGTTHHQVVRRVAQRLGLKFTDFVFAGALTTEAVARLCGLAVATWAANGFPDPRANGPAISQCVSTLVEWLLPPGRRAARENPTVWQLLAALSATTGLHHLCRTHHRHRHARCMLRAFSPGVQHAMLHGRFGPTWIKYVTDLTRSIWDPDTAPADALCYVAFSSRAAMWYIGKSTSVRERHDQHRPGWVERFREHLLATRRRTYAQAHRERYRAWATTGHDCVHMVPFAWVSSAEVYWLESLAIRLLQPPAQRQDATADRLRARTRSRPWPQQRRKPTLQEEARLCLQAQLARAPRTSSRLRPCGLD